MNHCFFQCNTNGKDEEEQNDCAAKCYANVTLLVHDGKFNKNIARRIYENHAFHEAKWMKVINESFELCEYDESATSLAENMAKFFECINSHLENNCVSFVNSMDCDKVQELFEKCHNHEADCTSWPQVLIHPDVCCKTPQLFSQHAISVCRGKCSAKELFLPRQLKCMEKCLFSDTSVKVDGKFDFKVVLKLLTEHILSNPEWEKPIVTAVEKCETKIKGLVKHFNSVSR